MTYTLKFKQATAADVVANRIRIRPANSAAVKDAPFDDVPKGAAGGDGFTRIVLDNLPQMAGKDGRYDVHVTAVDDAGNESSFLEVDNQSFDLVPPDAPTAGTIEQS